MNKNFISYIVIFLATAFFCVMYVNVSIENLKEESVNVTPVVVINKMRIFKAKTQELSEQFKSGRIDESQAKAMGAHLGGQFIELIEDLRAQGVMVIDEKGAPLSIPSNIDKTQWFARKMGVDLNYLKKDE